MVVVESYVEAIDLLDGLRNVCAKNVGGDCVKFMWFRYVRSEDISKVGRIDFTSF